MAACGSGVDALMAGVAVLMFLCGFGSGRLTAPKPQPRDKSGRYIKGQSKPRERSAATQS